MFALNFLSDKHKYWIEIIVVLIFLIIIISIGISQATTNINSCNNDNNISRFSSINLKTYSKNTIKSRSKKSIVILPFKKDLDYSLTNENKSLYERIIGLISNHLVEDFIVIDPFAAELKEYEYQAYWKLAHKKPKTTCIEICRRFACDIAYIAWIDQKETPTADGYHRVTTSFEGNGYDAAARTLGINFSETVNRTLMNFFDAQRESHKILAEIVGEELLLKLRKHSTLYKNILTVRVEGNISAVGFEIFNEVINSVEGVDHSSLKTQTVSPNHSNINSIAIWNVYIDTEKITHAELAMLIRKGVQERISCSNKSESCKNNLDYSDIEINSLKHIVPVYITSSEIAFTTSNTINKRNGVLNF